MQKLTMRKYKKEEEQYFTEYDPSKFYGLLNKGAAYERNVLMSKELNGDKFKAFILSPNSNGYGGNHNLSFQEACNHLHFKVFEFDTRKELLLWLLEEDK